MERILIIDADPSYERILISALDRHGYQARLARDGRQAFQIKQEFSPDVILLDWALPDIHGLEVCRQLRQTCTTPIILLTQRSERSAPLRSLELCADDTMMKPFTIREALAHIQAALRRVKLDRFGLAASPVQHGPFSLDPAGHRALKNQRELQLSAREFDLLTALIENAGQAISRSDLMVRVWGSHWIGDTRTLDVHVRWLRLKIEEDPTNPNYIKTIHGFGYRFAGADEISQAKGMA